MNTRKTIYDKLFTEKVELAKHEVELGAAQDLEKELERRYNFNSQYVRDLKKIIVSQ